MNQDYQSVDSLPSLISYYSLQQQTIREGKTDIEDDEIKQLNQIRLKLLEEVKITRMHIKKVQTEEKIKELKILTDSLQYVAKLIESKKDNIKLKRETDNQKQIIRNLSEQIIEFEQAMKQEFVKLQQYHQMQPNMKESEYEKEIQFLKQQLEQEQLLRLQLQQNIDQQIEFIQKIFAEAKESKMIIIEELKTIKIKKDELDHDRQLLIDERQVFDQKVDKAINYDKELILSTNKTQVPTLAESLKRQLLLQSTHSHNTQRIFD